MKNTECSKCRSNKLIKKLFISISILVAAAACVISCFYAKGGSVK